MILLVAIEMTIAILVALAIAASYHVTRKARPKGKRPKQKNPAKKQD